MGSVDDVFQMLDAGVGFVELNLQLLTFIDRITNCIHDIKFVAFYIDGVHYRSGIWIACVRNRSSLVHPRFLDFFEQFIRCVEFEFQLTTNTPDIAGHVFHCSIPRCDHAWGVAHLTSFNASKAICDSVERFPR